MQEWFRAWLQYRIIHLQVLWRSGDNFHKIDGKYSGPYIPRWKWVSKLLEQVEPTLYNPPKGQK